MTPADDMQGPQPGDARPSPPTERGQARRARIVNTAIRLMWRDGFSAVGIDTILKEAGAQKGSFYHYFGSKTDLLLACLDHLWGVQRQQLEAIRAAAPTGRAALAAHLEWFCEAQRTAHRRYGYIPGLFHMSVGVARRICSWSLEKALNFCARRSSWCTAATPTDMWNRPGM
jgi:AcrR family transcriptional regulator